MISARHREAMEGPVQCVGNSLPRGFLGEEKHFSLFKLSLVMTWYMRKWKQNTPAKISPAGRQTMMYPTEHTECSWKRSNVLQQPSTSTHVSTRQRGGHSQIENETKHPPFWLTGVTAASIPVPVLPPLSSCLLFHYGLN